MSVITIISISVCWYRRVEDPLFSPSGSVAFEAAVAAVINVEVHQQGIEHNTRCSYSCINNTSRGPRTCRSIKLFSSVISFLLSVTALRGFAQKNYENSLSKQLSLVIENQGCIWSLGFLHRDLTRAYCNISWSSWCTKIAIRGHDQQLLLIAVTFLCQNCWSVANWLTGWFRVRRGLHVCIINRLTHQ